MKKMSLLLVVLGILSAACNASYPPPGNYYIIPVTGTLSEIDYSFCEYNNCWNGQIADGAFAPTQDVIPTEIPTTVPEVCMITPKDSNVNVRSGPAATNSVTALMRIGYETQALALYNGWYKIWWLGDSDYPKAQYGWTKAEYYTTSGVCSNLPNG